MRVTSIEARGDALECLASQPVTAPCRVHEVGCAEAVQHRLPRLGGLVLAPGRIVRRRRVLHARANHLFDLGGQQQHVSIADRLDLGAEGVGLFLRPYSPVPLQKALVAQSHERRVNRRIGIAEGIRDRADCWLEPAGRELNNIVEVARDFDSDRAEYAIAGTLVRLLTLPACPVFEPLDRLNRGASITTCMSLFPPILTEP